MRTTLTMGLFVAALTFAGVASSGCDGGSGGGSSGASGASSGGSSGQGTGDDDGCVFRTTLSGGVDTTFGDTSQACAYTSSSVVFAPLDAKVVVGMTIRDLEPGATGSRSATLDVTANDERWTGASCTVNVESNVKVESASDAGGISFDQYLLKGSGSCSTPAMTRGDAGTKPPVTIAPFTFVSRMLFY